MSRYFVDKLLFQLYNDDAALEAYRADGAIVVASAAAWVFPPPVKDEPQG